MRLLAAFFANPHFPLVRHSTDESLMRNLFFVFLSKLGRLNWGIPLGLESHPRPQPGKSGTEKDSCCNTTIKSFLQINRCPDQFLLQCGLKPFAALSVLFLKECANQIEMKKTYFVRFFAPSCEFVSQHTCAGLFVTAIVVPATA